MFEKFMMPLDRQYDDGFEVTAGAFKDAATKLAAEHEGKLTFLNGHLPINFLYRHSVELFLKSSIITLHRSLKLPTGDGAHTKDPSIQINGKWKPIHATHSVQNLYDTLSSLLTKHKTAIDAVSMGSFDLDPEWANWIATIEASDGGSTYFRYPKGKGANIDVEKSGFQAADPEKLLAEMQRDDPGRKGNVVLGLYDDDGNIVNLYSMTENPLPELREALVNAANMTEGIAMGLNAELVHGFSRGMAERQAKRGEHDESGGN